MPVTSEPNVLNPYQIPAVGIKATLILTSMFVGQRKFKFGITMSILNNQYKKLAENVAIPTPISPNFGISANVKNTPIIPEISLIINSMWVLLAKWYCNVV